MGPQAEKAYLPPKEATRAKRKASSPNLTDSPALAGLEFQRRNEQLEKTATSERPSLTPEEDLGVVKKASGLGLPVWTFRNNQIKLVFSFFGFLFVFFPCKILTFKERMPVKERGTWGFRKLLFQK